MKAPDGTVVVVKPEDLLVERILVAVHPEQQPSARECAKKFVAVILGGGIAVNWSEVRRVALRPEYRNLPECEALINAVADELKLQSPFHPA